MPKTPSRDGLFNECRKLNADAFKEPGSFFEFSCRKIGFSGNLERIFS